MWMEISWKYQIWKCRGFCSEHIHRQAASLLLLCKSLITWPNFCVGPSWEIAAHFSVDILLPLNFLKASLLLLLVHLEMFPARNKRQFIICLFQKKMWKGYLDNLSVWWIVSLFARNIRVKQHVSINTL